MPSLRHVGQTLLTPTDTSYQLIGIYRDDSPTLPDGTPVGATDVIFHNGYTMYDADPRRVTVTPRAVTVPVNGTAAFAADVRAGFGPTAWSASCGAIDADGNYTAPGRPGHLHGHGEQRRHLGPGHGHGRGHDGRRRPAGGDGPRRRGRDLPGHGGQPAGPDRVDGERRHGRRRRDLHRRARARGLHGERDQQRRRSARLRSPWSPWLGTDAVGTAGWNAASTGVKRCTVFTDAGGGSARGLVVHYRGSSQVTGSATLRGVIYDAPGGQPGALVESTVARTVNAGDAARWATLAWSDGGLATLVDGRSYCLGFVATGDPWVIEYPFDVAADAQFANANPDDNPPSDPFGPASGFDVRESVYVDFSPTAMAVPFRRVARSPSPTAVRATRTPPRPAVRALAARRDIAPKRVTFRRDRRVGRVAR